MPIVNRPLRADHLNQSPTCQLSNGRSPMSKADRWPCHKTKVSLVPIRSPVAIQQHLLQFPTCQLTHLIGCCRGIPGQVHHIEMGPNRHDASWNIITVCPLVHHQLHRRPKLAGQILCWYALIEVGEFRPDLIRTHTGRCPLGRIENELANLDAETLAMAKKILETHRDE